VNNLTKYNYKISLKLVYKGWTFCKIRTHGFSN